MFVDLYCFFNPDLLLLVQVVIVDVNFFMFLFITFVLRFLVFVVIMCFCTCWCFFCNSNLYMMYFSFDESRCFGSTCYFYLTIFNNAELRLWPCFVAVLNSGLNKYSFIIINRYSYSNRLLWKNSFWYFSFDNDRVELGWELYISICFRDNIFSLNCYRSIVYALFNLIVSCCYLL